MTFLNSKAGYNTTKEKAKRYIEFNTTSKIVLTVLITPLLVYYGLLLAASLIMAYIVFPINPDKLAALSLLVLWSMSGFLTSLAGFILIIKFQKSTIIFSLSALSSALLLEYALTLYEYQQPKISFFTHVVIIMQLGLIAVLSVIAHRLRIKDTQDRNSLKHFDDPRGIAMINL